MLQGSGVELITVRTNLRELHEKWYDVFALGLASGFSLLVTRIRRRPHRQ